MVALQPRFLVLLALCVVASSASLPSGPEVITHLAPTAAPHAVRNSPDLPLPSVPTKMIKRVGPPPLAKTDKPTTPDLPVTPPKPSVHNADAGKPALPKPAVPKADSKADKSALPAGFPLSIPKTIKRSTPAPALPIPAPASPAKPPAPNAVKPEESKPNAILSALIPETDKRSQPDSPFLTVAESEKRDDTDLKPVLAALPVKAGTQPNRDSLQFSESEGQKRDTADPKDVLSKLTPPKAGTQSKPGEVQFSESEGQKRDTAAPKDVLSKLTPPKAGTQSKPGEVQFSESEGQKRDTNAGLPIPKIPSLPTPPKRSTEGVPEPLEHPPIERQRFSRAMADPATNPLRTAVGAVTGTGAQSNDNKQETDDAAIHPPTAVESVDKNEPVDVVQTHGEQHKDGSSSKDVAVDGTGGSYDKQLVHANSQHHADGENETSNVLLGGLATEYKQTMKRHYHGHEHFHGHDDVHHSEHYGDHHRQ